MNQAMKRKWVKALLSGKYQQGLNGYLHRGGEYCCLGVARSVCLGDDHDGPEGWLSDEEASELGISQNVQGKLADLNDSGVPFDIIAGLIDEAL